MVFNKIIGIASILAVFGGCVSKIQTVEKQGEEQVEDVKTVEVKEYKSLYCYDNNGNGLFESYQLVDEKETSEMKFLSKELSLENLLKLLEKEGQNISGYIIMNK